VPIVDVLHLAVIAAGLGIGAWSLIAFRTSMPRGRFAVFGVASAGALFGCAALSGEVGLLPPAAWFFIVVALIVAAPVAGRRLARAQLHES
jgi:hypothetical protein